MSDEDEKCDDAPQYRPTREDYVVPFQLGRRMTPMASRHPNGAPIVNKVSKTFRRIGRKTLMKNSRRKGGRIDREIDAARATFTEKTNSHEKKRLLKKEREYRRARRKEEQRLARKMQ